MPGDKALKEFKAGKLHSGSKTGKLVKDRKQAIAIYLSENGKSNKKKKASPKKTSRKR